MDCIHSGNNKKFTDWFQILVETEYFENIQSENVFYRFK